MYVTPTGMVEGDTAHPVPVPADVVTFSTPFLTDIAHNADPSPQDGDHNPATPPVAPVPDPDSTASADFAKQPAGTYDDELLDAHFTAGDGRVNENIGLSAIHQVFHSEHDRLVADFQKTLTADTTAKGIAALAEWKLTTGADGWNGERLFQAARFVAEMEYQHLVFEEFARKVQPALQPFHVYHTDIDPAVKAEFAHAVYRFGHSMLTETISRTNADGSDNSIRLLDGFLNPPSYTDGGPAGTLTPAAAAGSIVMGMSNQTGNELDEFMTDTLRNNLVGLPLDLAATNIARAREAGIPSLNQLRRQLHDATGDGQLTPYTSWADYGQNVKHPESLVNFVAAYGTFPTITAAKTLTGKRAAAQAVVDPGPGISPTADALDFLNSTGAWADHETGLNDVDLWVGGLAEKTNLFGGLLGSTFNYVFENQLTDLQNGDRFYYLARTPGLNLRAQLEGNSFAEIIMRNTDGTDTLKADVFATADCKFQLAHLAGTPTGYTTSGATVADDPSTDCNESALLLRKPDGTLQYREKNTVNPPGINGQAVYNGTAGTDRVTGGNDNDTFWGDAGNDVIEGAGGDDVALGGDGNDKITDTAGNDVLKGGPGNDSLNSGPGNDIILGGNGQDATNGGANDNETFAGPGNDIIQSGDGADTSYGDGGDDWIQGGSGQDLLIGDHGAPFFDDPGQTQPGNDILIGQVGENDYDAEGGDDIMSANAAIDRYAGAAGYDWTSHQYDTVGADDDMNINRILAGTPLPLVVNRDRWQETEASSGSAFDDTLRGDDTIPSTIGGGGFTGCDVLDQTGIDRITGLAEILPTPTTPLAPVEAASAPGQCPLNGPVWGAGNILLGGPGNDTLQGRGGDDILDGDRYLKIRISVRDDAGTQIGSTDLMEHPYQTGNNHTLAADIAAGIIDPGNLVPVREIITPTPTQTAGNRDTAIFTDIEANYTITTTGGDGTLGSPGSTTTITHNPPTGGGGQGGGGAAGGGATVSDGTDTLRNIERLVFADTAPPAAPVIDFVLPGDGQATVGFTPPAGTLNGFTVKVLDTTSTQVGQLWTAPADATSLVVTGLTNGNSYQLQISATNTEGTGAYSPPSAPFTPLAPLVIAPPGAPTLGTTTAGDGLVTVRWSPPASDGGSPVSAYFVHIFEGDTQVGSQYVYGNPGAVDVNGLTNGTAYSFDVSAYNYAGTGAPSERSAVVVPTGPAAAPGAPTIGAVTGGNGTATVRWTAPASDGGSAITGYEVRAFTGTTLARTQTVPGTGGSAVVTGLTNGKVYTVEVRAINRVGTGQASARSAAVTPAAPAVAPGAPTIGTATPANAAATIRWTAPASNGGSAITGYTVRAFAGAATARTQTVTGTGTSVVVTGLTNKTAYTFEVSATNRVGTSKASARSAAVTPRTEFVPPAVTARTPGSAAKAVSRTANLTATFSEPVTGAATTTFVLRLGTTLVPAAVTYNATTRAVTLNPGASLAADRTYTATLSGMRDNAGNLMATTTWSFTTGPAPVITASSPAAGAAAVRRNANVTATFSEAITGVSAATVRLTRVSTGAVVTTTASFNPTTRVLTIDPALSMAPNAQYRATITGGTGAVRDPAGNPVTTRTWTFTTGSAM
jgi:Ca2+-binding RTX toxin-like protein